MSIGPVSLDMDGSVAVISVDSPPVNTLNAAVREVWMPKLRAVIDALRVLAVQHRDDSMLAHTHGQPATPTTLGKEMANVAHRLTRARGKLAAVALTGKVNGATGNFNAHVAAVPAMDWPRFARAELSRAARSTSPSRCCSVPSYSISGRFRSAVLACHRC